MLRKITSSILAFPILSPVILAYALTKDPRTLDLFYSIRSAVHGMPLRKGLRLAHYRGNWILFPAREDPAFEDVVIRDVYFPYKPNHEDVVIDVGAHMGFFAVRMAREVKEVLAFEPDPYNARFLTFNIECNALSNILTFDCALGEQDGTMFLKRGYGFGRTRLTQINTGLRVRVRTLDSVLKELAIVPSLVKIDTEGYELKVLAGAESMLAGSRPRLLIASYHYPGETNEAVRYLLKRGFRCFTYDVPLTLQKTKETYVYAEPFSK